LGPIELATDILDGLGDARVSSQVMIVMRAQDVQSDILIIRDIDQSLLAKEVAILVRVDQGSGGAIAETVVVKSGLTHRHVR